MALAGTLAFTNTGCSAKILDYSKGGGDIRNIVAEVLLSAPTPPLSIEKDGGELRHKPVTDYRGIDMLCFQTRRFMASVVNFVTTADGTPALTYGAVDRTS